METDIEIPVQNIVCVCDKLIEVIYGSCGMVNCPSCGMLLKIGACDA